MQVAFNTSRKEVLDKIVYQSQDVLKVKTLMTDTGYLLLQYRKLGTFIKNCQ